MKPNVSGSPVLLFVTCGVSKECAMSISSKNKKVSILNISSLLKKEINKTFSEASTVAASKEKR